MNKIKIDLSGIEDRTDRAYEIEIKLDDETTIIYPYALLDGHVSMKYGCNEYYHSNNVLLARFPTNRIEEISGEFKIQPLSFKGIWCKEIKERKG